MLDKSRLPDPLDYFTSGAGLALRERKGKWRTTSCLNCASSDAMRVNAETGAFVCMTGCGARGGDILAYHQAANGVGFVDACKQLGAWVEEPGDEKRQGNRRPTPFPARDALEVLADESMLIYVIACDVHRGATPSDVDMKRLGTAVRRIATIRDHVAPNHN